MCYVQLDTVASIVKSVFNKYIYAIMSSVTARKFHFVELSKQWKPLYIAGVSYVPVAEYRRHGYMLNKILSKILHIADMQNFC